MFTKGTFRRYMVELASTQQRLVETYQSVLGATADPSLKKELTAFLEQLKTEMQTAGKIRDALGQQT